MNRQIVLKTVFILVVSGLPLLAQTIPVINHNEVKLPVPNLFLYEPAASDVSVYSWKTGDSVLVKCDTLSDSTDVLYPKEKSGALFIKTSRSVSTESFEFPAVRTFFKSRFEKQRAKQPISFLFRPMLLESDTSLVRLSDYFQPEFNFNSDTLFKIPDTFTDELYLDWNNTVYLQIHPAELILLEQALYRYLCQSFATVVRAGLTDPLVRLSNPSIPVYMPDFKIILNSKMLASLKTRMDVNERMIRKMTAGKFLQNVRIQILDKMKLLRESTRLRHALTVKLALKSGIYEAFSTLEAGIQNLDMNRLRTKFMHILLERKYILVQLSGQSKPE